MGCYYDSLTEPIADVIRFDLLRLALLCVQVRLALLILGGWNNGWLGARLLVYA